MKIICTRVGGLIIDTKKGGISIFPANCWFAKSRRVVVIFRIGFSFHVNGDGSY